MKIRKFSFIFVFVFAALVFAGCNLIQNYGGSKSNQEKPEEQQSTAAEDSVTIIATGTGFDPATVTVRSGGALTWSNASERTVQIGSDNHPTHTVNQDITGEEFVVELAPGTTKTITVTKVGVWGFHDHLAPESVGTVEVLE